MFREENNNHPRHHLSEFDLKAITLRVTATLILFVFLVGCYRMIDFKGVDSKSIERNLTGDHVFDFIFYINGLEFDDGLNSEDLWDGGKDGNEHNKIRHDSTNNNITDGAPVIGDELHYSTDRHEAEIHPLIQHLIHVHRYLSIRELDCGIPVQIEMIELFERLFDDLSEDEMIDLYQQGMQLIETRASAIQRVCGWN